MYIVHARVLRYRRSAVTKVFVFKCLKVGPLFPLRPKVSVGMSVGTVLEAEHGILSKGTKIYRYYDVSKT